MSLDVSLYGPPLEEECVCRCGHEHKAARRTEHFDGNITHNLTTMADAAGIYKHLWHPDEVGAVLAGDLIPSLDAGLQRLLSDPIKYKNLNPPNGWGDYDGLVRFVTSYLDACRDHPEAVIEACG